MHMRLQHKGTTANSYNQRREQFFFAIFFYYYFSFCCVAVVQLHGHRMSETRTNQWKEQNFIDYTQANKEQP